jgi:hypothetical protein
MKAKEYLSRWEKEGRSKYELGKIGLDMLKEMQAATKSRHISTESGAIALLREFNDKWRAFCRLGNDPVLRFDGFLELVAVISKRPVSVIAKAAGIKLISPDKENG